MENLSPLKEQTQHNTLKNELEWLQSIIDERISSYFERNENSTPLSPPPALELNSPYAVLVHTHQWGATERIILCMSLAVHAMPDIFDIFFTRDKNYDRGYTIFGGVTQGYHSGFIPTLETVAFITGGKNLSHRIALLDYFSVSHSFYKFNILHLKQSEDSASAFDGVPVISDEYLNLLLQNKTYEPYFSATFPARKITTRLVWEDAVFDDHTLAELDEIKIWMKHEDDIMSHELLRKHLKKGYRVLFHGPPGTGKTMTAALLGKEAGMDVYQIDLSMVVSKYIGETEKNLAGIFDQAESKNWILFFDEADSLFGKRTSVKSSNDQFANQQVGYLLQRIEDFDGMVILATNFKDNIDSAFLRRFQSIIYFPKPRLEQRLQLWQNYFSHTFDMASVDFQQIASEHEITGGSMINVLRYCTIAAKKRNSSQIYTEDILKGINKEYHKDGITI